MNSLFSFGAKVETPIEVYRKTLSRHKHLIQNNQYAQELEKQYNKFRHKTQKESVSRVSKAPHLWPINSTVFTQVLRNKLSTALKAQTPKASTRPVTRINKRLVNQSQNSVRQTRTVHCKKSLTLYL